MTITALPFNFIEVPPPPMLGGGILGAARVISPTTTHDLGGAQYLTDACGEGNVWLEFCATDPQGVKTFDGAPDLVQGSPFVVYSGIECMLRPTDEHRSRASLRLDFTERHQIDLFVTALLEDTAVDLGGPFPLARAIGVLENFAASVYGGVPVIYLSRALIPAAAEGSMVMPGLTTIQGSRVANIDTDPQATQQFAYISGQITLIRGPLIEANAPPMTDGNGGIENNARALAERIYVPLIECFVARVEVCADDCGTP